MRLPFGNPAAAGRRTSVWVALALAALFAADAPAICGVFAAPGLCDGSAEEEDGDVRDANVLAARPEGVRIRDRSARPVRTPPAAHVHLSRPMPYADPGPFDRGLSPRLRCLPILADALEDAGCVDPAILLHCRGAEPPARDCWIARRILESAAIPEGGA